MRSAKPASNLECGASAPLLTACLGTPPPPHTHAPPRAPRAGAFPSPLPESASVAQRQRRFAPGSRRAVGAITAHSSASTRPRLAIGPTFPTIVTAMNELVFEVTQEADGGYVAEALGEGVITQADTWDELRDNVREAVAAYFFDRPAPTRLRLHLVRDEVIA